MKEPKYTDRHRYPNGYKPANQTNIRETFDRIERDQRERAEERLKKCIALKVKSK